MKVLKIVQNAQMSMLPPARACRETVLKGTGFQPVRGTILVVPSTGFQPVHEGSKNKWAKHAGDVCALSALSALSLHFD